MKFEVRELTKSFKGTFTLGPINFSLKAGATYGIFGHNGAGKSTFFSLLSGNLDSTTGVIEFNGRRFNPDSLDLKMKIGYLPQDLNLPDWATGIDLLSYAAALKKLKDPKNIVRQALSKWDALMFADKPIATYSHGMQKRIGLALISLSEPDLLILDEPFSGLDFHHIATLKEWINERHRLGRSTLISSHIVPFIAELSHHVAFIHNGHFQLLENWNYKEELGKRIAYFETNIPGR